MLIFCRVLEMRSFSVVSSFTSKLCFPSLDHLPHQEACHLLIFVGTHLLFVSFVEMLVCSFSFCFNNFEWNFPLHVLPVLISMGNQFVLIIYSDASKGNLLVLNKLPLLLF